MREPLLADAVEDIPDYYNDPGEDVLAYAAESLRDMELLERRLESYRKQRKKQGEAEGLLERGYEEDDHVAFVWETTDQGGEEARMTVDSYVIGDRLDRVEEELQRLERGIVEVVAELRDWSGEIEEDGEVEGPVKAVSVAYSVVNYSLAGDADQSGSVAAFREEDREAYEILAEYANNRKSLDPDMDTLDRYVTWGGTFRQDNLFGAATLITLGGVDALEELFDDAVEEGRAIARTATERLQEREEGKEIVPYFDWELRQEQKAMTDVVEARDVDRIYQ